MALIPPVSGGAFRLVDGPLDPEATAAEVSSEEAGAVATFTGTVWRRSRGREVLYLEYEAYAGMAEAVMEEIAAEVSARHELTAVAIHHRIGRVEVGEPSVVAAVPAPHRSEALTACHEAIDALKERVPLWKKEAYGGGEGSGWDAARRRATGYRAARWPITRLVPELIRAAQVQAGERAMVLDATPLAREAEELAVALRDVGAEPDVVLWAGERPFEHAPAEATRAARASNVGFHLQQAPRGEEGAARFEVLHARRRTEAGYRSGSWTGAARRRAVAADARPRGDGPLPLAQLEGARELHIRAPAGTDLTMRVEGRTSSSRTRSRSGRATSATTPAARSSRRRSKTRRTACS